MKKLLKINALNVVRLSKCFLPLLFLCFIIAGCCDHPTEGDRAAMQMLTKKFGDRYTFELDGELWLVARAKKNVLVLKGEEEEMYKVFFCETNDQMKKRNTTYVYIDLYDSDGKFICQLSFDHEKKVFGRDNMPYRS